ncbi:MAG TPA: hypothetical protein VNQ78_05360 [Paracoccus sp. (in: a-proteobacteria)]|nr:hypothetical protein [Paracoccus sp. (in: a-proteobacteria)]
MFQHESSLWRFTRHAGTLGSEAAIVNAGSDDRVSTQILQSRHFQPDLGFVYMKSGLAGWCFKVMTAASPKRQKEQGDAI